MVFDCLNLSKIEKHTFSIILACCTQNKGPSGTLFLLSGVGAASNNYATLFILPMHQNEHTFENVP
jgi:hypothetical protein